MFDEILTGNHGEIAARILRACREMGIVGVAVYSDVDHTALHVQMAEEAYPIGPAPSCEGYLRVDELIARARTTTVRERITIEAEGVARCYCGPSGC